MDLVESLQLLAEQNISGVAFLLAYGATWLVCGVLWQRVAMRVAAYATLFQGLVALPVALGVSFLIGAVGSERPVADEITQLSVLIGMSQVLGLPLLIYLVVKRQFVVMPFVFAVITAMHFVLYSWLYQTPIYIAMAMLISVGTMITMLTAPDSTPRAGPARVSFLTGGVLAATGLLFVMLHAVA